MLQGVGLLAVISSALAQTTQPPTPVRILKQINRQNEDGSYSYGYENEDGSYKIETKSATGEIFGKYGYIDVEGKLREIEYGASKRGFEPVGPGIKVPPPTIHEQNENNVQQDYDDGQYREDPSIYEKTDKPDPKFGPPSPNTAVRQPEFRYETNSNYNADPSPFQYKWYQERANEYAAAPYNADPAAYQGHPGGTNYDIFGGSYTVNYSGWTNKHP